MDLVESLLISVSLVPARNAQCGGGCSWLRHVCTVWCVALPPSLFRQGRLCVVIACTAKHSQPQFALLYAFSHSSHGRLQSAWHVSGCAALVLQSAAMLPEHKLLCDTVGIHPVNAQRVIVPCHHSFPTDAVCCRFWLSMHLGFVQLWRSPVVPSVRCSVIN